MFIILLGVLILIQSLIIRKKKHPILCCGLWCYVGDRPADGDKLKVLALYNEYRGDDATGICIDNNTIYKDVIKSRDFIAKHNSLFELDAFTFTNFVILGHSRKATMGYDRNSVNFAHPHKVTLGKKDCLRLVHNGTITNIDDLADKYGVESKYQKSDSIMMAEIIAKNWGSGNMDVLKEYAGAATLIFYNVEDVNTLYVHRDRQRELFCWLTEGQCYISSIKDSLLAIGADEKDLREFEEGILYKIVEGEIVKKWNDFKSKTPYYKPVKAREINYSDYTRSSSTKKSSETTTTKDGFYWENHLIKYNGHAFVGEMCVPKSGGKVVSRVDLKKAEVKDHDIYFIIGGIVMKNRESYEALFKECTDKNAFSPEKLKKMLPSTLQKYAMYPVLGKTFAANNEKFFWSDELDKLKTVDEKYSWSPILSGKKFKANRAGFLMSEELIAKKNERANEDILQDLIEQKVKEGKRYQGGDLLDSFKRVKKETENVMVTYDVFTAALIKVFKRSRYLDDADIINLETLLEYDVYTEHGVNFTTELYNCLSSYQSVVEYVVNPQKENSHEVIPSEDNAPDSEYYKTENFKADFLFADYESLEDAITNYIQDEGQTYLLPLLYAVAKIFLDLGLISKDEFSQVKKSSEKSIRLNLGRIYDDIKTKKYVKAVSNAFASTDINTDFANLYKRYEALSLKNSLTSEEDREYEFLKVGLNYIKTKAYSIDTKKLLSEHNITEKELQSICS